MPQDQRRNNGPDTSVAYRYHSRINLRTYADKLADAFQTTAGAAGDRRADGRQLLEPRKIFIKSNLISQAKGSAYIELGAATKVIVAVYDPREIPNRPQQTGRGGGFAGSVINGELYCDFKFASFASAGQRHLPQTDALEKSLAQSMKRALESVVCRHEFPNFQVDIFAHVLQDDGGALSAAITAAGLALADAGIPLYDVITARTVGYVGGRLLLDPNAAEEDLCTNGGRADEAEAAESAEPAEHGLVTMARLSTLDQVSELWQTGSMRPQTMRAATDLLAQSTRDLVPVVQQILVRKVLKQVADARRQEEAEQLSLADIKLEPAEGQ